MMYLKRGFTLIELLVVIAIIGGLSAILLPNYMDSRQRARDSQRKSDLKQIQKALEMYKMDNTLSVYPTGIPAAGSCWSSGADCTGNIYMNKVPGDPKTPIPTPYAFSGGGSQTYQLTACLENTADTEGQTCAAGVCSSLKCLYVIQP